MLERLWEASNVGSVLAWFPDGMLLACTAHTGEQPGEGGKEYLTLRAAATGALVMQCDEPCAAPVLTLACAPDGTRIASAGSNAGEVEVWHVSGERLLVYRDHPFRVVALAWSPDGRRLASVGSEVRVWESRTGETHTYLLSWGRALAFAPDGQRLAVGGTDLVVRVFDPQYGELLLSYPGHRAALWEAADVGAEAAWDDAQIAQLSWSLDGRLLVSVGAGTAQLWEAATGTCLQVQRRDRAQLWGGAWRPMTPRVSGAVPAACTVLRAWAWWPDLCLDPGTILQAAWSPDGERLAATLRDGRLLVWQVGPGGAADAAGPTSNHTGGRCNGHSSDAVLAGR